jgi:pectate lyase
MIPVLRALLASAVMSGLNPIAVGLHASPSTLSRALRQPLSWYASGEARQLADNVVSWQSDQGSWPKGVDTLNEPAPSRTDSNRGTFDNGATRDELRFLARAYQATDHQPYREAFLLGLDAILAAQYPSGGWPQSYPPGDGYARHITFNDDTMVGLIELLREIAKEDTYAFVGAGHREAAQRAVNRGIDCILRCQIRVGERLTVWCAQHDAETLAPRPARSYELESLSGAESADVLLFLMSLEDPSPEIVTAVHAGARWFESVQIKGIRQIQVDGDKRIVADPDAPPLWARFYEIETLRPFFCGRDGVKKYRLSEIESERRNGYAWYGDWGRLVLERYVQWHPE